MTPRWPWRVATLALLGGPVVAISPLITAYAAGNHYNEIEQTVHNIMPPSSSYTLKELCLACHVDGKIYLPGMPQPPEEETALPTFLTEKEQRPAWDEATPVKNFSLPQSWPIPAHLSADRPFGSSADCLGCHDGAFAEDVHGGKERMTKGASKLLTDLLDKLEAALGTNPEGQREIPDHPVSTIYPRKPDGELAMKEPVSSQRRFFSIADLQDDQLVLPTGPTSRFYAQTPGYPEAAARPPNNNRNNNNARAAASASAAGNGDAPDPSAPFRLIHTTFGVMHCDSCHNAHSELHAGFLRDKSPQLCLVCHDR